MGNVIDIESFKQKRDYYINNNGQVDYEWVTELLILDSDWFSDNYQEMYLEETICTFCHIADHDYFEMLKYNICITKVVECYKLYMDGALNSYNECYRYLEAKHFITELDPSAFLKTLNEGHIDIHIELMSITHETIDTEFPFAPLGLYFMCRHVLEDDTEEKPKENKISINPKSYLYVVGNRGKGIYKIGISKDPEKRVKTISTYCPFKIDIINKWRVKDNRQIEKELHEKYSKTQTNREWFALSSIDISDIRKFVLERA